MHAQQYRKQLSDAESEASKHEHRRHVAERWAADSPEYQNAAQERKCYHVHRLQNKLIADVDWLRWSSLAVSRNPRQQRGINIQMKKKVRDAKDRLKQTILQLKAWHDVPYHIGVVGYDASALDVEELQQPGWKAPWQHAGQYISAQHQELHRLQQLKQRCDEELLILCREAGDMVEYYTKQTHDLNAALLTRRAGQLQVSMPACPPHVCAVMCEAELQRLEHEFVAGQRFVLANKVIRSQQLLARAESLQASLLAANASTMQLSPIPVFDKHVDAASLLDPEAEDVSSIDEEHLPSDFDQNSEFAELDLEDPALPDVNDFGDMFEASVADELPMHDSLDLHMHDC